MLVIVMRGISGAGKTSWIEKNCDMGVTQVLSADKYHVDNDGVYRYKKEKASEAHKVCLMWALNIMMTPPTGVEVLCVDNTNTSLWELSPYYRAAEALGHRVKIVEIKADPHVCATRNLHGTPAVTIGMMHQNMITNVPPEWWNREVYDQDGNLLFSTPRSRK